MLALIKAEVLLFYFTTFSQEVSAQNCHQYVCIGDICKCESSTQLQMVTWIIPVIGLIGGVIGCCVFVRVLIWCCRACKGGEETRLPEEPRRDVPRPPPVNQTVPSAPSLNQFMEPPPYTEVGWKLPLYPTPMEEPPAYDNIAMEGLPPLDVSRPPGFMPEDRTSRT
ncbi:uncharacterized protein LOC144583667 [Pogona vitticeps]